MDNKLLSYIVNRKLYLPYIERKCFYSDDTISVPIYRIDGQYGWQDRYINPGDKGGIKSKTRFGSKGVYFFNGRDKDKDILIVEGEIDFLSIIPYATNYNLMGLKGVNNLGTAIKDIERLKKVYDVYILVDNDEAATTYIQKIPYTELHLYDVRQALGGCKDVNEAICKGKLNMQFIPNRIIKEKPKKIVKKRYRYGESYDTVEKINEIPVDEILERLYPQYEVCRDGSIEEMGKKTNGYKFWKQKNVIVDFSGKDRPIGNTFMIAKHKFKDSQAVFQYFKTYL